MRARADHLASRMPAGIGLGANQRLRANASRGENGQA